MGTTVVDLQKCEFLHILYSLHVGIIGEYRRFEHAAGVSIISKGKQEFISVGCDEL